MGSAFRLHSRLQVGMVLADPGCLEVVVAREILINRNSVLFSITLKDKMVCYGQGISGHHLLKTSLMVKVVGSSGNCFQNTHLGLRLQVLELEVLALCGEGRDRSLNGPIAPCAAPGNPRWLHHCLLLSGPLRSPPTPPLPHSLARAVSEGPLRRPLLALF